ncbi:hypothetical protein [Pasteuria penetrans]|uniref:hypothetical protein n=1 Tax=Pasteuria penetrans TaxID=86005 RepID=UPI000FA0F755|nr:hypothetical protein [Pasteuria penetrans]
MYYIVQWSVVPCVLILWGDRRISPPWVMIPVYGFLDGSLVLGSWLSNGVRRVFQERSVSGGLAKQTEKGRSYDRVRPGCLLCLQIHRFPSSENVRL